MARCLVRWLEDTGAAWVQLEDGSWAIYSLDEDGKPVGPAGIHREMDAAAAHTPWSAAVKLSRPVEAQQAAMWPAS